MNRTILVIGIIFLLAGISINPAVAVLNSDDTTPPITTLSFNPEIPTGENDWYVTPVTITLEATDDMSGVNTTYYSINSEPWEIYEEPFVLTEDSLYDIVYFSVDNAGNMEFPKLANVKVDQTPPFINLTYKVIGDPYQGWELFFTAIAFDQMSGMDRVEVYHDCGHQKTIYGSGPFYRWSFVYCGPIEVRADAYDRAGNMASDVVINPVITTYNQNTQLFNSSVDNNEAESFDDFEEIITLVSGVAHMDWIEQRGPFRGEVYFYSCSWCSGIDLYGLRFSNGAIETYRLNNLDDVHIPRYVGFIENTLILGIAIGDIEWSG
jgi:hypothetical protein